MKCVKLQGVYTNSVPPQNRNIFVKLLEASLAIKRQCAERFTEGFKSRLFYTVRV